MAQTKSFTGKEGTVSVGGTDLGITGWTIKMNKMFADSVDSSTYDPVTGQVWDTQEPGVISLEGTIKGYLDLDTFSDSVIAKMINDGPFNVTLGFTRARNFVVDSPFDFTDCSITIDVPGATMASFDFSVKSHGVPTFA